MKKILCLFLLFSVGLFADAMPQSCFILKREGYCLEYDGRLRQPSWVYEVLSKDSIDGTVKRERFSFLEDKDLPPCVRSTLKDYRKAGMIVGIWLRQRTTKAAKRR